MGRAHAGNRELLLTICTAVLVPAFLALGYWQLMRATSGNTLSWAYVFEWPLFAGYLIYVWWRLRHERPASATSTPPNSPDTAETTGSSSAVAAGTDTSHPAEDDEDEELAAYNRYLAALDESGRRKHW